MLELNSYVQQGGLRFGAIDAAVARQLQGLGAANEDPLAAVGSLVVPLLSAESLRFRCSLLGCQPRFGLLVLASNPFFSKLLENRTA